MPLTSAEWVSLSLIMDLHLHQKDTQTDRKTRSSEEMKGIRSRLILCDPMGCSTPGSSVRWTSPGKNTIEWETIPFSSGSS